MCAATMPNVLESLGGTRRLGMILSVVFFLLRAVDTKGQASRLYDNMTTLFVLGSLASGFTTGNYDGMIGALLTVIAGIVIRADLDGYLFGIRRVDGFHYVFAAAVYFYARGV
jgi:hypothetical protein